MNFKVCTKGNIYAWRLELIEHSCSVVVVVVVVVCAARSGMCELTNQSCLGIQEEGS